MHEIHIKGWGTQIVPRVPFVMSFRPPRLLLEHDGRAVMFGPPRNARRPVPGPGWNAGHRGRRGREEPWRSSVA